MIIKFSRTFVKQKNKAPKKIQKTINNKIKLLVNDPRNSLLNLHKLKGILKDYYSINVSGDWRIILKITKKDETVLFMFLGTHSELYK